jgi:hypothetical protein
VFDMKYSLNFYISFRRNSVFIKLIILKGNNNINLHINKMKFLSHSKERGFCYSAVTIKNVRGKSGQFSALLDHKEAPKLSSFSDRLTEITFIYTPWPQSASELYRPSDRLLSAKLVPTFADRKVSRSQRGGSLRPYSRFLDQENFG